MAKKKSPPPETPLSRTRIAEHALRLIDADGLESLSTRRLAATLGVEAMSLYYHLPSKASLLDAVVELLLEEIVVPASGGWRERLIGALHSMYALAVDHPHAYLLLANRRWNTPTAFDFYERVLGLFIHGAGLDPEGAARAFRGCGAYTNGAALARIASYAQAPDTEPPALQRDDAPLDRWPLVARVAPHLRAERLDALFAETLPRIVDALCVVTAPLDASEVSDI